jgi:N-acetylglutamate synthase-like GNAT family acetyltransferase
VSTAIRPATAADRKTIRRIVRRAGIFPFGLEWHRFLVAEEGGRIVAVGQVKPHRDGSRELASIAVVPDRQGEGLGGRIVRELLAREQGPLYLFCRGELEPFYAQFGFEPVGAGGLPPVMSFFYRVGTALARLASLLGANPSRLSAMRLE